MKRKLLLLLPIYALLPTDPGMADGWNPDSQAPNNGSVVNSRHNLTISYSTQAFRMDGWINKYGEVCVFCHTPHGASSVMGNAPLWNRSRRNVTFTLYNRPTTLNQAISAPGSASLMCLSCHDGSTSIDSVINMPGSGNYSASQETNQSIAFLNTWGTTTGHAQIDQCASFCHNVGDTAGKYPFTAFVIGSDLRNDHPVGVQYPTVFGPEVDFNVPSASNSRVSFFDLDMDSRLDKNEVRMYETGGGYEVECSSCHDPHGVESAGPGSEFIPSFLRVSNNQSTLCLTCHVK